MKKAWEFITDLRIVVITISTIFMVLLFIAGVIQLPSRVEILEAKDIELDGTDTELEIAQTTLSATFNSVMELHKEQMKQNTIDHRRYEKVQAQLTELHLQRVVNGNPSR